MVAFLMGTTHVLVSYRLKDNETKLRNYVYIIFRLFILNKLEDQVRLSRLPIYYKGKKKKKRDEVYLIGWT